MLKVVDAMDKNLLQAYDRYFTHLSQFGYMSYENVKALLLYDYINDIIKFSKEDLTNEDIITIEKVIDCLLGSNCLIDFPADCLC